MTRAPDPALQRALAQIQSGRCDEAIADLRRMLQRDADNANVNQLLGQAYLLSGRIDQAVYHLERALMKHPRATGVLNNLANALVQLKRYDEAIAAWNRAVEADPTYAPAYLGLCMGYAYARRYDESVVAGRRAIQLVPRSPEAHQNTALSLLESGRPEEAMRLLVDGHSACPQSTTLHSMMLIGLNYVTADRRAVFESHRRFGMLYKADPSVRPAATPAEPERPLRLGILSSDFHTHSVAFFLEPLLRHRDRERWSVHMFASDIHAEDQTRQRLRDMGDSYIDVVRLAPMQLDARIRAERIDVLLELGGHSAGNRLPGLLGKPAPLIVTAIGYPHTTGVPAVDYRVVDSLTDPPGAEAFATERLLRLDPCFLCYRPPTDAPDVAAPPSSTSRDAPITFASFNALYKLSNEAIALWSRVLSAVPSSVFVLRGAPLDDPAVMSRIRSRFEACGVSGSRVRGVGSVPTTREHLARYGQIDVALDVIPYHGTTTTCEALWMGVPVVSLVGESHASRVGLSLLTNVGHPEWAVRTPDEFVRVASELASDRTRLATIRSGLREQVRRSPLCDEAAYAGRFYAALRECWRTWCASRS